MATVLEGQRFDANFGRVGFRREFPFRGLWQGKMYGTKQIEVFAVQEREDWLVITVITRFF